MADIANANATEEEKLKAVISQSGEGFDPSQYVYMCYTCILYIPYIRTRTCTDNLAGVL